MTVATAIVPIVITFAVAFLAFPGPPVLALVRRPRSAGRVPANPMTDRTGRAGPLSTYSAE